MIIDIKAGACGTHKGTPTAGDALLTETVPDFLIGNADEKIWDSFGQKCITCGGCAFVCPTCTCFNVYDHQSSPGNGLRARTWDACLYGGFTREASGLSLIHISE